VFIIRHDIEKDFTEHVLARMKKKVPYELAFQELDSLIPPEIFAAAQKNGRTKPWGTCHALLCAEKHIDAPFTVINADDFYGREAYAWMASYLKELDNNGTTGAIVPYKLEKTLSPRGTVTRGVCVMKDGMLTAVDELKAIEKQNNVIFNTGEDGKRQELSNDTPVSMNFWGFPASILCRLHEYFDDFLKTFGGELKSECYIPLAVDRLIKQGALKIQALAMGVETEWFGVTYKEDKDAAVKRLAELTAAGEYPQGLWK
jgi:hypothetical protein